MFAIATYSFLASVPIHTANLDLSQYGIGVPKGSVAHDAKEAEQVAKSIGMHPNIPSSPKHLPHHLSMNPPSCSAPSSRLLRS